MDEWLEVEDNANGGDYQILHLSPVLKYQELPKKSTEQTRQDGVERRDNQRPKHAREGVEVEKEKEKEPSEVERWNNQRPKHARVRKDVVEEKEPSGEEEEDGATENSTFLQRSTCRHMWEV